MSKTFDADDILDKVFKYRDVQSVVVRKGLFTQMPRIFAQDDTHAVDVFVWEDLAVVYRYDEMFPDGWREGLQELIGIPVRAISIMT